MGWAGGSCSGTLCSTVGGKLQSWVSAVGGCLWNGGIVDRREVFDNRDWKWSSYEMASFLSTELKCAFSAGELLSRKALSEAHSNRKFNRSAMKYHEHRVAIGKPSCRWDMIYQSARRQEIAAVMSIGCLRSRRGVMSLLKVFAYVNSIFRD